MSRARAERKRRPLDDYPTPGWAIDVILPHLPLDGVVLEPACGAGAILAHLLDAGVPNALARGIEIDAGRAEEARALGVHVAAQDALDGDPGSWGSPHLIITNPPFRRALPFVERALREVAPGGVVAMLLRIGFIEGKDRRPFHQAHPADLYVLSRRPSFTGGGSDTAAYAWWVWGPGRGGRYQVLACPSAKEVAGGAA